VIVLHETPSGITFAVRVQPRARRNALVGELGEALKISLTAPPIDGRANDACIEFLAEVLKLPRSSVTIVSGQGSRNKIIRVAGCTVQHVTKMLDSQSSRG
jgi:uncharacterized protein (TIGR00251 family)